MSELPKISIVTPTYNCAAYLRQCIESVLAQNYPNLEHLVADGASTDGTVEILKEYPHLKWVSEPDKGEADALNKALKRAQGDIIGWLNGDDYYVPDTLHRVAREVDPTRNRHVVYGNTNFVDKQDRLMFNLRPAPALPLPYYLRFWENARFPRQPSIFYSRQLMEDIGPFSTGLYYAIDYDHWLRTVMKYEWHYVDQTFSAARQREDCKSAGSHAEQFRVFLRVSAPYHRYLTPVQRLDWWQEYWRRHRIPTLIAPLRIALGIRTRLRSLKRRVTGH